MSPQVKAIIDQKTITCKNNLDKWETYYKKILTLSGSDDWTDEKDEVAFKVKALVYLLHDYGLTNQFEKVPDIAKQLLFYENQHYSIHEWPTQGESLADAKIALIFLSKDFTDEEKLNMLKDVFMKYGTFGIHGSDGQSYSTGALILLLDCVGKNDDKLESEINSLLADPSISKNYREALFMLLGNVEFAKESNQYAKNPTQDKTWEQSRKYYSKALEYNPDFGGDMNNPDSILISLKKFVTGDWTMADHLPVPPGPVIITNWTSFDFVPEKLVLVP
jgi:tetratricopeptide (TPR) repeat protein